MTQKIQIFQHVLFEGPALIQEWADENGHTISLTKFFAGDPLPEIDSFDMLIVLGGPMGVGDLQEFPWLEEEIRFIEQVINKAIPVLGICLGAQLIARALGSKVYRGEYTEIGWYPVTFLADNFPKSVQEHIPADPVVYHWHGDTFDLPNGAKLLAETSATPHQGFFYDDKVIGLQFHLETNEQAVENLLANAADELVDGIYIQSLEKMRKTQQYFQPNKNLLFAILEYLSKGPQ